MKKTQKLSMGSMTLLLGAIILNYLVYNGGRMIAANSKHYMLSTLLDDHIPFISWTVFIYWGCYIFWIINYYICTKYDKGDGYSFIGAHYIGEIICFLFFVFFPTTMIRSDITGNSISAWMIRLTYQYDEANNLLPSIHCFVSWLCWIGVRKNKHIPRWYQVTSLVLAVSVCISTLTVKQHVVADVLTGIALAEISYFLSVRCEKNISHASFRFGQKSFRK